MEEMEEWMTKAQLREEIVRMLREGWGEERAFDAYCQRVRRLLEAYDDAKP